MRVRYRACALSDLDDIYRYLEPRSPTGARNVLRTIHAAIDDIAQYPYSAKQIRKPTKNVLYCFLLSFTH